MAEWRLLRADDNGMLAEGTLARVPARLRFEMSLAGTQLRVALSLIIEQDFSLESLSLVVPLPAALNCWGFDGEVLTLADITPSHVHEEPAAMPDSLSRDVLAYSPAEHDAHALALHLEPDCPAYLHLMNGDYLSGARRLFWTYRPSPSERAVRRGDTISLGVATLDLGISGETARARADTIGRSRQCESTGIRAHMGRGCVTFETLAGIPLGELQVLLCYGGLWTNSTFLAATPVQKEGDSLCMVSRSNRLPLELIWRLSPEVGGIRLDASLLAKSAVALEECNFSLLLPCGYTHWQTKAEELDYPAFDASQEWRPLPTRYLPASAITLSGDGVHSLTFSAESSDATLLPSALNTGAAQGRRVAQWIRRAPGSDAMYFDAGSHSLFSAIIRLESE